MSSISPLLCRETPVSPTQERRLYSDGYTQTAIRETGPLYLLFMLWPLPWLYFNYVLRGLRGVLNFSPIMPGDTSLSYSYTRDGALNFVPHYAGRHQSLYKRLGRYIIDWAAIFMLRPLPWLFIKG